MVYVGRRFTAVQTAAQLLGIFLIAGGMVMALGAACLSSDGLLGIAAALAVLGLPLLLAKKHPLLIMGWLAVALSCLALNPYTSVSPWGLVGGLWRLYAFIKIPEIRYPSTVFAIAVGIVRGLLTLILLVFTGRACGKAWKDKRFPEKK